MGDDQRSPHFDRLLRRIERIERALNLPSLDEGDAVDRSESVKQDEQIDVPSDRRDLRESTPATPPTLPATPPVAPPVAPPIAAARSTPPVAPSTSVPPVRRSAKSSPAQSKPALEQIIGGKWAAWVAALLIVIATGFAIKLGIDAGWWGALSAAARCLIIAGFGGVLIIGGEIALRRISRAASVGLFGAGIGVLYLDAFASFAHFNLLSREMSFVLMAITALVGFAITLRTKFRTIGVLSLIAGYATPIMLHGATSHSLEVLAFLTALLAVALGLSAFQPRTYRLLRYVALALHMIVALVWLINSGPGDVTLALVFMSLWWCMLLAETMAAALRDQSPRGNPIAMLIATAGYVTAGCWLLQGGTSFDSGISSAEWLGLFTGAIALISAAAAMLFGSGADALREPPRHAVDKLSIALWMQFGVLIVVANALQFGGMAESIGWLAIALASIEIGRRLPSRGVDIFGIIVGALALLRIITIDAIFTPGLTTTIASVGGIAISRWAILVFIAIATVFISAHRLRAGSPQRWRAMAILMAAVGTMMWLGITSIQATSHWTTALWLVACALLFGFERFARRQAYFEIGVFALAATALKWTIIDPAGAFGSLSASSDVVLLINWRMLFAVIIVAMGWWCTRILIRRDPDRSIQVSSRAQVMLLCSVLFMLLALSFEVFRAIAELPRDAGVVDAFGRPLLFGLGALALWATGAGVMMWVSRRPDRALLLMSGWVILVVCAIAWLSGGTLVPRLMTRAIDAMVVLNPQFGVGALLAVLFLLAARWWRARSNTMDDSRDQPKQFAALAWALLGLIGLWLGSIEIDRALMRDPMAVQAGLSVYWALYGVMLVVIGFMRNVATARYAGLGLLAITVAKVLLVDMATVRAVWRVVSFLVSGLLLIGTSILYTKLSPKLVARDEE